MNILFLTMNPFSDIDMHNIYSDLMKEFIKNGHRPYIVSPREHQSGEKTELCNFKDYSLLKVRIGNTSNVSFVRKGISTVLLSFQYYWAIRYYLRKLSVGLLLFSTPPITLMKPIKKLKRLYKCSTYLMLKDIFPQNAVDLGIISKGGLIHRYFRRQEKKLYALSDNIGCMSKANIDYLLNHNPEIDVNKVEICPNGIIPKLIVEKNDYSCAIRKRYSIPDGVTIYLYGGNLGKPQGILHLIKCMQMNADKSDRFFLICGNGSEFSLLNDYITKEKPSNVLLFNYLPKQEYDFLVAGCDVGLVFLDCRFSIPNYPSRILTYMENSIPLLVCSDNCTDVGTDAQKNGYGLFCEADDPVKFTKCVDKMNQFDRVQMGKNARSYLEQNFTSEICYKTIMSHKNEK